ncbi:MAG: hypothetical protein JO191_06425, partial [Mycobacteriaceae bacterium]|nr:hypothetical protein [Mycobacteriaceae bacterium]
MADRAAAAQAANVPAAPIPTAYPGSASTMRTPGASSHRAIKAVSSTSAPPSGASAGSTIWAPARATSTSGIGGTPRAAVLAPASCPCRITAM